MRTTCMGFTFLFFLGREMCTNWMEFCSKVFVSFGGLLLYMEGPYKKLTPLRIDYVYLLIKK